MGSKDISLNDCKIAQKFPKDIRSILLEKMFQKACKFWLKEINLKNK
jgi:hypothetical protein